MSLVASLGPHAAFIVAAYAIAVLVMGITFVLINLFADILYSILDPRIVYK
jgi:ABC-type dipeptide/oligopeptide/nickel transport system permease component